VAREMNYMLLPGHWG